jgi:phenylalanyl-tRNA synthetase beta chain
MKREGRGHRNGQRRKGEDDEHQLAPPFVQLASLNQHYEQHAANGRPRRPTKKRTPDPAKVRGSDVQLLVDLTGLEPGAHLETAADAATVAETATNIGLEVEAIEDKGASLAAFRVARVISAVPHPNADKLRLCVVDTGNGTAQVVCGAPNAREGLMGVFAPPGTYIPGSDFTLTVAKIRGVESRGMLVSERELQLSNEHDGIIELSADAPIGSPAAAALGLTDPVIDVAITPNRGDCTSVFGIARDLAAAGLGTLKPGTVAPVPGRFPSPIRTSLEFPQGVENAAPMFAGRLIRGVKNGPSPEWLQKRLKAVGLRPISAIVDVTNLVAHDRSEFEAD